MAAAPMTTRPTILSGAMAWALVLANLLASPAQAAFPGRNGRLTFTSWSRVWTIRPDGSNMSAILKSRRRPFSPQWSPDGNRIAYSCGGGYADICVMNADGSGNERVTESPEQHDGEVAWAPDGERLIFVRDATLVIVDLRTGQEKTVVAPVVNPHSPSWSPDASEIAVTAIGAGGRSDIFVLNVGGSNVRNLTDDRESQHDVDWSPDGKQLVYSAYVDDNNGGWALHIISADGSSRRRVSERHMFAVSPSWSPNGRRIAFSGYHDVGSDGSLNGYQSIYTIRTDGTRMRNLFPNNKRDYYSPDWQPQLPGVEP